MHGYGGSYVACALDLWHALIMHSCMLMLLLIHINTSTTTAADNNKRRRVYRHKNDDIAYNNIHICVVCKIQKPSRQTITC